MVRKDPGPLSLLAILIGMYIITTLLFLSLSYSTSTTALTFYKKQLFLTFINKPDVLLQLIGFGIAQLLTYAIFLYALWYVTVGIGELLELSWKTMRLCGFFLWAVSVIAILMANTYFVPHSIYSQIILSNPALGLSYPHGVKITLMTALFFCMVASGLALLNMIFQIAAKQHLLRHGLLVMLVLAVLTVTFWQRVFTIPSTLSVATAQKPNIFIIGFDALRPDYLSYFNQHRHPTPQFDNFLKSSVVFEHAFTPVARTFPSWVSILTAEYPLYTNAREDNIDLASVRHEVTLAKILQEQGYETIYASDDNRFSNVNNPQFGFDVSLGADGSIMDFMLNAINDFPLSNLLLTTQVGQLLFPVNFANHASAHTYDPDNFLQIVNRQLRRNNGKPIFLAAHFNVTSWPFFIFGKTPPAEISLTRYKNVIKAADSQLGKFLALLAQDNLLEHAIFVLISDHGITLGLPHDREIAEATYQGNLADVKVKRSQYTSIELGLGNPLKHQNDETHFISLGDASLAKDIPKFLAAIQQGEMRFNPGHFGIDTSWGYGSDVLSLKQNHALLAFRIYGKEKIPPHQVAGRCLLLDIGPTLLDFLNIPFALGKDGISLKTYLTDRTLSLADERPFFFETSFTLPEIEKENIDTGNVLLKTISLWQINPKTSLVSMVPLAQAAATQRKQRAILWKDWLLAYYPSSIRYKHAVGVEDENPTKDSEQYTLPAYRVLLNVKTGQWTIDLHNAFAATAPLQDLTAKIQAFYGAEMHNYDQAS